MSDKRPFWVECKSCQHKWAVAYLPMQLSIAAELFAKAMCPSCGARSDQIAMARQKDGVVEGAN